MEKPLKAILLVVASLIGVSARADCPADSFESAAEAISRLSCDTETIASELQKGRPVVPSRLYHFGKKRYLLEDIEARAVPEKAWAEYIMGEKTSYGLPPSRRGLYGTGGVDGNGFGGRESNWLMEIHIKPECLVPQRLMTMPGLLQDTRFKEWYAAHSKDLSMPHDKFASVCFGDDGQPNGDYYGFEAQLDECDTVVTRFMNDLRIAVVQDHIEPKSFYIRDRSCIKTIRGTADEWISILAEADYLWTRRCGNFGADHIPALLLQSLAERKEPLKPEVVKQLKKRIGTRFPLRIRDDDHLMAEAVDAAVRCERRGRSAIFTRTIKATLGDSIDKLSRLKRKQLQKLCR